MFDVKNERQAFDAMVVAKNDMYYRIEAAAQKHTCLMRLTGIGIGVSSSFLTVVAWTAAIGEAILKGFINLFGAGCAKNCKLISGAKMLGSALLVVPFAALYIPIHIAVSMLATPLGIFISPKKYANFLRTNAFFGQLP